MSQRRRYGWRRGLVHLGVAFSVFCGRAGWAAPAQPVIWAFGDSLVAGYGLLPDQGFPTQLQSALRRSGVQAIVRNGGIAGDTAAQAEARLRWGLRGLGTAPDLAIVELGANDMLRGLPVAQARAHLAAILTELQRRHIAVLLAGMRAAPNMGPDYARPFDAMFAALAREHHVALYPFYLAGVAANRTLLQADGLHPNARGVTIIVARMLPAVRAALPRRSTGG